jgi:hypothetical protein
MELAELRAMRTPVPARPSGMMPVTGKEPRLPTPDPDVAAPDDEATVTQPIAIEDSAPATKRAITSEEEGDEPPRRAITSEGDDDAGASDADIAAAVTQPLPARRRPESPAGGSATTPRIPATPQAHAVAKQFAAQTAPRPSRPSQELLVMPRPTLPTAPSGASTLPWMLVGGLGVAVLGLLAYIVLS